MYSRCRWLIKLGPVIFTALLSAPAVSAAESGLPLQGAQLPSSGLRKIPGSECGYLPADLTQIQLLTLTTDELQQLAGLNPYVAVALLYAQLGEVVGRSPFGSKTRFGASLTPDQAARAALDLASLEQARSPFDRGYAVVVEDSFEALADGRVARRFLTRYRSPSGASLEVYPPLVLVVRPVSERIDHDLFDIKVIDFVLDSVRRDDLQALAIKSGT